MRIVLMSVAFCGLAMALGCATSLALKEKDLIRWTLWGPDFAEPGLCHDVFRNNAVAAYRVGSRDSRESHARDPKQISRIWAIGEKVWANLPQGDYSAKFDQCFTIEIVVNNERRVYRMGRFPQKAPMSAELRELWGELAGLTKW